MLVGVSSGKLRVVTSDETYEFSYQEYQEFLGAYQEALNLANDGVANWKAVSPASKKKLQPLVQHYMKKKHPFTACVRDNTKRFGKDRAERMCAVLKDIGYQSTKWRGKD